MRRHCLPLLFAAASFAASSGASAQDYPNRGLRWVLGFAPGASTDNTARVMAQKVAEAWGRPVVVDNRPGADGNIAAEIVAKATPDGHTLLISPNAIAISSALRGSSLPFVATRDFEPVSLMVAIPNLLLLHPSVPATTLKELLDLARAKPGQLPFASSGVGTTPFMGMALLQSLSGTKMIHVPFKGSGPATTATLAGETHLMFGDISSAVQHVKAGKLRAVAISSIKRSPVVPEIPTVAEQGFPGFDTATWIGLMAPAGTPKPIVSKLHAEVARIIATPEVRDRFTGMGFHIIANTPAEFAAVLKGDIDRWSRIVRELGLKPD